MNGNSGTTLQKLHFNYSIEPQIFHRYLYSVIAKSHWSLVTFPELDGDTISLISSNAHFWFIRKKHIQFTR